MCMRKKIISTFPCDALSSQSSLSHAREKYWNHLTRFVWKEKLFYNCERKNQQKKKNFSVFQYYFKASVPFFRDMRKILLIFFNFKWIKFYKCITHKVNSLLVKIVSVVRYENCQWRWKKWNKNYGSLDKREAEEEKKIGCKKKYIKRWML